MQNRYTGDIGDYVKYGLLRALASDQRLGVAWYLYPDEGHNDDGRHVSYLERPADWEHLDPDLYQGLRQIVRSGYRSVQAVENSGLLPNTKFASELLEHPVSSAVKRRSWRHEWFNRVTEQLSDCDIVFADPDNGLCADDRFRPARRKDWKRIPLEEAVRLANDRTAILYHHNSRFKGGHRAEIAHWMERLPGRVYGLYWRRYSNRTFLIVNASGVVEQRLIEFAQLWGHGCELV